VGNLCQRRAPRHFLAPRRAGDRAIAGDAVAELPPFLATEALRDGRLVALLPDHPFPEQEVTLLYQRHRQPSRVVRAYLDYCQREIGRYLAAASV